MNADARPLSVARGILLGQGLSIFFVLFEYFLVTAGISDCGVAVDACIRAVFGVMALLLMKGMYGEGFSALFTAKIPRSAWLCCLPFFLYMAIQFLYLPIAGHLTTAYLSSFLLVCVRELMTGFWEEAASKGLVMSGMLARWKGTVRGRIGMVFLAGGLFGALHLLNVLINHDIILCLWNALYASAFGVLLAAVYLHSQSLPLCMALHAVWDIIVRIPGTFCEGIREGAVLSLIYVSQDVLQLGVFPAAAVLVCVLGGGKKPASTRPD